MQSCLTLVRSYYAAETDYVSGFIDEHPTKDKNRLLSKILSMKMIKCSGLIQKDQVNFLQQFKLNASDAPWQKEGYPELIELDWEELRYKPADPEVGLVEGEGEGPVEMSSQEIMMSNEVEEYSDELRREQDDELRGSMGKTTIAFFNIEDMGPASKAIVLVIILTLFGLIGKFFHGELYQQEKDVNVQRKEALRARREKKAQ